MESSTTESNELLFKVLVIGDYAVGKTALIKRYSEGTFTPNYKLTIGVDFSVKQLVWEDESKINLQLWDVAGHERFGTMTRVYYKYAIAAIIVFDLSRPATFDAVAKWRHDVNSKVVLANNDPIPCLLIANKCDLPGVQIDKEGLDEYVRQNGYIGWFPTSAQNDYNINEAINFLVKDILRVSKQTAAQSPPTDSVKLSGGRAGSSRSSAAGGGSQDSGGCC